MDRQVIRETAGRVHRSEDLTGSEKELAAEFLRENPALGNPHMVRCDWCYEKTMLFRDEDMGTFTRTRHGWRCTACNEFAASQEVRF
jgi:Cysteine-rich small domain